MKFTEYQNLLPLEILETVQSIHAGLSAMGFTEEIKEAKSGPVLSYTKDKKVLLNYVYRKSGIKVRLYAAEIALCMIIDQRGKTLDMDAIQPAFCKGVWEGGMITL